MTDLNPKRSGNPATAANAAHVSSKTPAVSEPPEWMHRYLKLSPRLRQGYRRFVGTLPDGPQRLHDLDEQVSQWPDSIDTSKIEG
jgi:hypothetical protein